MKKDYCKDFIILLCIIGVIGCVVAISKLDSRLDNVEEYQYEQQDRKSTRLNSSHANESRMPSSA